MEVMTNLIAIMFVIPFVALILGGLIFLLLQAFINLPLTIGMGVGALLGELGWVTGGTIVAVAGLIANFIWRSFMPPR